MTFGPASPSSRSRTEPAGHVLEAGEGVGLALGAAAPGAQVDGDRRAARPVAHEVGAGSRRRACPCPCRRRGGRRRRTPTASPCPARRTGGPRPACPTSGVVTISAQHLGQLDARKRAERHDVVAVARVHEHAQVAGLARQRTADVALRRQRRSAPRRQRLARAGLHEEGVAVAQDLQVVLLARGRPRRRACTRAPARRAGSAARTRASPGRRSPRPPGPRAASTVASRTLRKSLRPRAAPAAPRASRPAPPSC